MRPASTRAGTRRGSTNHRSESPFFTPTAGRPGSLTYATIARITASAAMMYVEGSVSPDRIACRLWHAARRALRGRGKTGTMEVVENARPLHRFCKDRFGPRLSCTREIGLAIARDDDHARAIARGGDELANEHVTGHVGQSEIAQDDVEMPLGRGFERFAAVCGGHDVRALGAQQDGEDFTDVRGVFHHEDAESQQTYGRQG